MIEITFALIKPDAVKNGHVGEIISMMEREFRVCDVLSATWSPDMIRRFYKEHVDKPWFPGFEEFMTSGPMYAITLVGDDAVKRWRTLMGDTDPKKAPHGTIRATFGDKVGPIMHNAVHGSDSPSRAMQEIKLIEDALHQLANLQTLFFGDLAKYVCEKLSEA